jgi:DNA-binding response OmpR family regulator
LRAQGETAAGHIVLSQIEPSNWRVLTLRTDMPGKRSSIETTPGRPCLLVVDNNVAFSRAVSAALGTRYHVVAARTGAEASRKLRTTRPDVILLELMLPDTDGLLLMIALKAKTDAAVVVCTTRDDVVDRVLSLRLGAADFISKPVDFDDLDARLIKSLSGKAAPGRETSGDR